MTLLRKPSTYARAVLVIALLIGAQFISVHPASHDALPPLWPTLLGVAVSWLLVVVAIVLIILAVGAFVLALCGDFDKEDFNKDRD